MMMSKQNILFGKEINTDCQTFNISGNETSLICSDGQNKNGDLFKNGLPPLKPNSGLKKKNVPLFRSERKKN